MMAAPSLKMRLFLQAGTLTVLGGYMILAAAPYFMEGKDMTFSGMALIAVFFPVVLVMLYVFIRTIMKFFAQQMGAK